MDSFEVFSNNHILTFFTAESGVVLVAVNVASSRGEEQATEVNAMFISYQIIIITSTSKS